MTRKTNVLLLFDAAKEAIIHIILKTNNIDFKAARDLLAAGRGSDEHLCAERSQNNRIKPGDGGSRKKNWRQVRKAI